jgi:hypothetical protein
MCQQDKAFKLHNTPKVIKHQAALPKVPDYFWDDWHKKVSALAMWFPVRCVVALRELQRAV